MIHGKDLSYREQLFNKLIWSNDCLRTLALLRNRFFLRCHFRT
jgi:hypothetical protein